MAELRHLLAERKAQLETDLEEANSFTNLLKANERPSIPHKMALLFQR